MEGADGLVASAGHELIQRKLVPAQRIYLYDLKSHTSMRINGISVQSLGMVQVVERGARSIEPRDAHIALCHRDVVTWLSHIYQT